MYTEAKMNDWDYSTGPFIKRFPVTPTNLKKKTVIENEKNIYPVEKIKKRKI